MIYRGIDYMITKIEEEHWEWKYYPKKENGPTKADKVRGSENDAKNACKAAIDIFLANSE